MWNRLLEHKKRTTTELIILLSQKSFLPVQFKVLMKQENPLCMQTRTNYIYYNRYRIPCSTIIHYVKTGLPIYFFVKNLCLCIYQDDSSFFLCDSKIFLWIYYFTCKRSKLGSTKDISTIEKRFLFMHNVFNCCSLLLRIIIISCIIVFLWSISFNLKRAGKTHGEPLFYPFFLSL